MDFEQKYQKDPGMNRVKSIPLPYVEDCEKELGFWSCESRHLLPAGGEYSGQGSNTQELPLV